MTKLILLLAVVAIAALAVTGIAGQITRKRTPRALAPGSTPAAATRPAEDRAMRFAQLRAVAAVALAIVLFVAMFRLSIGMTGLVGLPVALAAGFSASAGLLLYSALPPAKLPAAAKSSAVLVRREPWSFAPRRAFAIPLASMAAFVLFLVATGITSSPDEQGRYRQISIATADTASSAGPYPGWFYGIPLIVATLVLAASAYLALRRIAGAPALPDPRMARLDRRWREISTRVVLRLATGAFLGYFGGTAVFGGMAMMGVSRNIATEGPTQPLFALGAACTALGAALAVTGVVLLARAFWDAVSIRTSVRQEKPEPVAAP